MKQNPIGAYIFVLIVPSVSLLHLPSYSYLDLYERRDDTIKQHVCLSVVFIYILLFILLSLTRGVSDPHQMLDKTDNKSLPPERLPPVT